MKRTLNINIGNSIIYIEEDAYEILTTYLNDIKTHFAKNADDFEIVTDIENRIAEMFGEILTTQQKQAINIADIQVIISQMGTVDDFKSSEENEDEQFNSSQYTSGIKRLYRDTDQGMVAGVCAGLGHYLNIEDRWIRLFALLSIFAGGAGLVAYLVMWIIVPRAQTRSEKMYMKGDAINLHGFIKNFQEEIDNNHLIKRSGSFITEFVNVVGNFINGTGKVALKLTAAFIIFVSSVLLVGSIIFAAAFMGVFDSTTNEIFPISVVNDSYVPWLLIAIFVVVAVPLLALILFSIRVAFNGRQMHRSVSFGLLILWLTGIGVGIFMVAKTMAEFREHSEITQVTPIKPYSTYTLELDNSRAFSREDSIKYHINVEHYKGRVIMDERDWIFNVPNHVRIKIEKSLDGKFAVTQNLGSNGKTFDGALKNAQNIRYDFAQQDSLLKFSSKLHLVDNGKWRNQEVRTVVRVPIGTKLLLNKNLDRYLEDYRSWDCNLQDNHNNDYIEWLMTEDGLKCKNEITGEHHHE